MAPLVSVVIPTRDRPDMLREAIATARAQTFTDHEIVVVVNGPDNPMTQKSLEVATADGANVVRIERSGIAVALNAGAQAARGEWIAFLDDDDLWEPDKLETDLKVAAATGADLIFSDVYLVDGISRFRAPPRRAPEGLSAKEAMTLENCGGGCSATMVRRSVMLAVGGFDEAMASPDWDLWMRLAWRYCVAWTQAYLVFIRHHGENTSKQISWAYWALYVQSKSLKTLPPDLRYLRPQILFRMAKVGIKGAEGYLRHNYIAPVRKRLRGK